jgi:hypothetical protein
MSAGAKRKEHSEANLKMARQCHFAATGVSITLEHGFDFQRRISEIPFGPGASTRG